MYSLVGISFGNNWCKLNWLKELRCSKPFYSTDFQSYVFIIIIIIISNSNSSSIAIITIIIIIIITTLIQGIYNYVAETNYVSRVYSVAGILYLQFMVHLTLFPKLQVLYLLLLLLL